MKFNVHVGSGRAGSTSIQWVMRNYFGQRLCYIGDTRDSDYILAAQNIPYYNEVFGFSQASINLDYYRETAVKYIVSNSRINQVSHSSLHMSEERFTDTLNYDFDLAFDHLVSFTDNLQEYLDCEVELKLFFVTRDVNDLLQSYIKNHFGILRYFDIYKFLEDIIEDPTLGCYDFFNPKKIVRQLHERGLCVEMKNFDDLVQRPIEFYQSLGITDINYLHSIIEEAPLHLRNSRDATSALQLKKQLKSALWNRAFRSNAFRTAIDKLG